jgi:hypothetical protein
VTDPASTAKLRKVPHPITRALQPYDSILGTRLRRRSGRLNLDMLAPDIGRVG